MSEVLSCQYKALSSQSQEEASLEALTVGQLVLAECSGQLPTASQLEKIELVLAPEQKYTLHKVKAELRTPNQADILLTSYLVGEHSFSNLKLTVGDVEYEAPGLNLKVISVLEKEAKAFGPIGPLTVGFPKDSLIVFVVFLVALTSMTVLSVMRFRHYRKEQKAIEDYNTVGVTAEAQLFLSVRKVQKLIELQPDQSDVALKALFESVLIFLSRHYQVLFTARNWALKTRQILKWQAPIPRAQKKDLAQKTYSLLQEFEACQNQSLKLSESQMRTLVDKVNLLCQRMRKSENPRGLS